jgi:hypothetical protein
VLTKLFLTLRKLTFQLCDLSRLIDLLALEGLQQIMHILSHLILDLVPFELCYFHCLLFGLFCHTMSLLLNPSSTSRIFNIGRTSKLIKCFQHNSHQLNQIDKGQGSK